MYPFKKDKKKVKKHINKNKNVKIDEDCEDIQVGCFNLYRNKSSGFKLYYPKKALWIISAIGYNYAEQRMNHRFKVLRVDPKDGKVRGKDQIRPFMEKHQNKNSKIWVDGFPAYGDCADWMESEYEVVNHVDNYRDPNGQHNNWNEGEWRELRNFLGKFNGIKEADLDDYIYEYMVRRDYAPDARQFFWMLIRELQLKYSSASTNNDSSDNDDIS